MKQDCLYERIRISFEKQSFLALLGAELERVEVGSVSITCENRADLRQQQAFLHGGVITTLADVACGYAALACMPEDSEVLSVELKINFLRPAVAKKVTARGQVLKAGKTLVIAEASVADETGNAIAKMMSTMISVKKD